MHPIVSVGRQCQLNTGKVNLRSLTNGIFLCPTKRPNDNRPKDMRTYLYIGNAILLQNAVYRAMSLTNAVSILNPGPMVVEMAMLFI